MLISFVSCFMYPFASAFAYRCRYDPDSCYELSGDSGTGLGDFVIGVAIMAASLGLFISVFVYITNKFSKQVNGGHMLLAAVLAMAISVGVMIFSSQNLGPSGPFLILILLAVAFLRSNKAESKGSIQDHDLRSGSPKPQDLEKKTEFQIKDLWGQLGHSRGFVVFVGLLGGAFLLIKFFGGEDRPLSHSPAPPKWQGHIQSSATAPTSHVPRATIPANPTAPNSSQPPMPTQAVNVPFEHKVSRTQIFGDWTFQEQRDDKGQKSCVILVSSGIQPTAVQAGIGWQQASVGGTRFFYDSPSFTSAPLVISIDGRIFHLNYLDTIRRGNGYYRHMYHSDPVIDAFVYGNSLIVNGARYSLRGSLNAYDTLAKCSQS
jgi:hypothetical protein